MITLKLATSPYLTFCRKDCQIPAGYAYYKKLGMLGKFCARCADVYFERLEPVEVIFPSKARSWDKEIPRYKTLSQSLWIKDREVKDLQVLIALILNGKYESLS